MLTGEQTSLPALAREHPNLRLAYMTVHGSKGLQADYVIVLGLGSGEYGFPSEIADDPLLELVGCEFLINTDSASNRNSHPTG